MAEATLFLTRSSFCTILLQKPSWRLPLSSIPENASQRCIALCAGPGPPCALPVTLIDPGRLADGK